MALASGSPARMRSRTATSRGALTPPGTVQEGWIRSLAKPSITCWPNLRRDAVAGQVGVRGENAKNIALRRVGVHAQQQVGRRKMEEAEGVRLHDLAAVQQLAQFGGRLGDAHA